jgi:hypothetical protein
MIRFVNNNFIDFKRRAITRRQSLTAMCRHLLPGVAGSGYILLKLPYEDSIDIGSPLSELMWIGRQTSILHLERSVSGKQQQAK